MRKHLAVACVLLGWPSLLWSADNSSWVGKQALSRTRGVKMYERPAAEGTPVGMARTEPMKVERVQGGFLGVRSLDRTGWIARQDVVFLDEAIPYFTARIEENGRDVYAYNQRAIAWRIKGDNDKAIADFDEALRLEPRNARLYNDRGVLWETKKERARALADYDEAIRLNPKAPIYHRNRGLLYAARKDYERALADYDEAIRLVPRYADAYRDRASTRFFRKEYPQALADYDEAVRLDPRDAAAMRGRGYAHYTLKQYDKAIGDYDQALRLNPRDVFSYRDRGLARAALRDYGKALADYDQAIRLNPKHAPSLNDRAWLLATCPEAGHRDGARAVESARRACELTSWKAPGYLSTLAAACAEDGRFEDAVKWQKKALTFPEYSKSSSKAAGQRLALYEAQKPYHQPPVPRP